MATIDVAVDTDLAPQQAWKLASDLHRFNEWLTIFGGWRSEVPSTIAVGTCVSSCIKVKGFRNVIHWRVTRYDEPKLIEMSGAGRGGVRINLTIEVQEAAPGSRFAVLAELKGGLLNTRIGQLVAKVLQSEVRKSVNNLAALR
ncbi:SRPBCC family protein [Mycobacterium sp. 1274761.0]|uniref:type II toxin-antitoxin system Rv0910 family toxin n=1 Tax=Mycobacterium sp. 1274761.0 TaxID=1834077 RepID=UPI0007FD53D2|nr:SRPBCC family protein [Mycobacterium sp. 1274761.0]OBK73602.1 polyketide cyclase / dehydrase and lipid transport [Mycobacterium sp. 1274761.0]